MRQLRLVHLSDDGSTLLVETADGIEQFTLPADAVLRAALRNPSSRPIAPAAPPVALAAAPVAEATESTELGPRDIQIRIRGGESPEQLAEATGMNIHSVLRFAAPVVAERRRIADEARRARARRTSNETQVVVFGEAVDQRFEAHGITAGDVDWDAFRREDGEWVVYATWHGGTDMHVAQWLFHRTSRTVTPADETAVDLLSDHPIRPIVAPQRPDPARHTLREAPPLMPGVVAFPPMPDAFTGPLPAVDDVFDQEAEPEGPRNVPPLTPVGRLPEPAAAPDPEPEPEAATAPTSALPEPDAADLGLDIDGDYDEQLLPLSFTEPMPPPRSSRAEPTDAERAARARIPSWDDILLGVRRKSD